MNLLGNIARALFEKVRAARTATNQMRENSVSRRRHSIGKMSKVVFAAVLGLFIAIGLAFTGTSPANAVGINNNVCLYQNVNFTGTRQCTSNLDETHVPQNINDRTSSIANNAASRVCFYRDANYRNYLMSVGAHSSSGFIPKDANDKISSFRKC